MDLTRVDDDDMAGRRDFGGAPVAKGLGALFDHADCIAFVEVRGETVRDVVRGQQIDIAQGGVAPESGSFGCRSRLHRGIVVRLVARDTLRGVQAPQPITLTGAHVRLEPLKLDHVADLTRAASTDPEIWRFMPYPTVITEADMLAQIQDLLGRQARGTDLPFAVWHLAEDRAIGMTRYLDIQVAHDALEIGGTWYTPSFQRTAVNTECKLLLLSHAFDTLGCVRVQIKTDLRNIRSQRAIERLGAVREGVLRAHMRMPDGYKRSSVYYSILVEEWPTIRARLQGWLDSR